MCAHEPLPALASLRVPVSPPALVSSYGPQPRRMHLGWACCVFTRPVVSRISSPRLPEPLSQLESTSPSSGVNPSVSWEPLVPFLG